MQDTFYDRMIILFFHLGFLLKIHKDIETKENLQKFVDSLSTVQFMRLSDFFRDMPGLKHVVEFKCECGKEQEQTLRGLSSFFT